MITYIKQCCRMYYHWCFGINYPMYDYNYNIVNTFNNDSDEYDDIKDEDEDEDEYDIL